MHAFWGLICSFSDPDYVKIAATGIFAFALYIVLIPVFLFTHLYFTDKSSPTTQARFGWIFRRYHPHRWYYELVQCTQKIAVATVSVLMSGPSLMLQALGSDVVITLAALYVHARQQPYPSYAEDPHILGIALSDNHLQTIGLLTQLITLSAGISLFYFNNNDCHAEQSCSNTCQYCDYGPMGMTNFGDTSKGALSGHTMEILPAS
eukprot:COSAG01_NODE_28178_length_667_cov_1.140845_1_plen_205_part_01